MSKNDSPAFTRSKWYIPAFSAAIGVVVLLVSWLGGQIGAGVIGLIIMTGFGLIVLLLSQRNETVRGLTIGRDERFAQIDLRATAVTGFVLVVAIIVAWLVQIAQGHSGQPYTWLGVTGGLTYLLAVAFFRWRG